MSEVHDDVVGLHCSFCGKADSKVEWIVRGPGVYICTECVAFCQEVIEEKRSERNAIPGEVK